LLKSWLLKNEKTCLTSVHAKPVPGAKESLTEYRVLAEKSGLSLLEIRLLTGRTHQIRAQMAAIGHALVGDGKYAPRAEYQTDKKRGFATQCLCAYRLTILGIAAQASEPDFVQTLFPEYAKRSNQKTP